MFYIHYDLQRSVLKRICSAFKASGTSFAFSDIRLVLSTFWLFRFVCFCSFLDIWIHLSFFFIKNTYIVELAVTMIWSVQFSGVTHIIMHTPHLYYLIVLFILYPLNINPSPPPWEAFYFLFLWGCLDMWTHTVLSSPVCLSHLPYWSYSDQCCSRLRNLLPFLRLNNLQVVSPIKG